jgi:hypothetical protein
LPLLALFAQRLRERNGGGGVCGRGRNVVQGGGWVRRRGESASAPSPLRLSLDSLSLFAAAVILLLRVHVSGEEEAARGRPQPLLRPPN